MKYFPLFLVGVFAAVASAQDLTVARGERVVIEQDVSYDNVFVSGTLVVSKDVTFTASQLALGPAEGDNALIEVLGSNDRAFKVDSLTLGANGGTGKIIALSPDDVNNSQHDSIAAVYVKNFTISENAAKSHGDFIDVLKIANTHFSLCTLENKSSSFARILICEARIGQQQFWGRTLFKGNVQLESFDNGKIRIGCPYDQRRLNDGTLKFEPHGQDVYFSGYLDIDKYDIEWTKLYPGVIWGETGDICIKERKKIILGGDDLLPFGSNAGILKIEDVYAHLQLDDFTVHINGLDASAGASAENGGAVRGAYGSKVVFGAGNTDGILRGAIGKNVAVEKTGTGVLHIDSPASAGDFSVLEGTVRVSSAFDLDTLHVAPSATLVIDGTTVSPSHPHLCDIQGNVELLNGGRIVSGITGDTDVRIAGGTFAGEIEKNGTHRCTIEDPAMMATNITVVSGVLSFSAGGYAAKLYKFEVSALSDNYKYLNLGEFAFVDENGRRVGKSLKEMPSGTPLKDLPFGYATTPEGTLFSSASDRWGVTALFDGKDWSRTEITNSTVATLPAVIYMRLPEAAPAVYAYNWAKAWAGHPRAWSVSCSLDDGETWHLLNANASDSGFSVNNAQWVNGENISDNVPMAFKFNNASAALARAGVKNMPETVSARVESGAVLDFSNVTGGQKINALVLDAANGAGTISNAVIAPAGTLHIVIE